MELGLEQTLSTLDKTNIKKFDIVIPVGPDETPIIERIVQHVVMHVKNFDKIYLITSDKDVNVDNCIVIHESVFPFNKTLIHSLTPKHPKPGWVFQQLLKLHCLRVIPELNDNILVLDADVYILNDLSFFDNKKEIFTVGYEHTKEYHEHAQRLHPSLTRAYPKWSGISHHMVFNRNKMNQLFDLIENHHQDTFFNVFMKSLDMMCSEYEIYFSFVCNYYPDDIKIRELRWANVPHLNEEMVNNYDYVSHAKWFGTR